MKKSKRNKIGNSQLPGWFHKGTYILMAIWFGLLVWTMWAYEQSGKTEWMINLLLAGVSVAAFGYGVLKRGNQISWNDKEIEILNRSKRIDRSIKRDEISGIELKLNTLIITYKDNTKEELDIYDLHLTYQDMYKFRKELLN